jgi:formate-dependent nitrite reductase membrane component NrfD
MVLAGTWRLLGRDAGTTWSPSRTVALLPWAAPLLLSVGMYALWLDLENRWNVFRFYLAVRPSSPMSWGSWILLIVYPASVLLAWVITPAIIRRAVLERAPAGRPLAERVERWALAHDRALAWTNIVVGAALGVYTGVLLGTMAARPLWNSAILGPLFLASGVSSAAAFLLLWRVSDAERRAIGRFDRGVMVVELALIALWLVSLGTGGAASRDAVSLLIGGPYTTAFWSLVVVMGLVTPLAAEVIEVRHGLLPGRVSAVLVLLGGFALRWIVVFAGQDSAIVVQTALGGGR